MTYALVRNDVIEQVGPPNLWFDGARWWDFRPQDPATYAAAGWLPVTDVAKPADTATDTYDRSVMLVAGVPTVTWTQRAWSAEELAARTAEANRTIVEQATTNALAANLTIISGADTYLAGHITLPTSPTTAQVTAAVKAYGVQVRNLTLATQWAAKQRNGLIRMALGEFDGTD